MGIGFAIVYSASVRPAAHGSDGCIDANAARLKVSLPRWAFRVSTHNKRCPAFTGRYSGWGIGYPLCWSGTLTPVLASGVLL
jgi:hypothetical protein